MDINLLKPHVEQIHGATFATLDALCEPTPGVSQLITGERVIIFRTNGASGYEAMVRKHLEQAGKNPDLFVVGPLPWGERVGNLPIITHNGKYYLQTIELAPGKEEFFLTDSKVPVDPKDFRIKRRYPQPFLPPDDQVRMHTYNVENIKRITLLGKTLVENKTAEAIGTRAILSIKAPD